MAKGVRDQMSNIPMRNITGWSGYVGSYEPVGGLGAAGLGLGVDPPAPAAPPEPASSGSASVATVVIAAAFVGIVGFALYTNYKVATAIAEREGSEGLLKYELGSAAIGVGSEMAYRGMRENPRLDGDKVYDRRGNRKWSSHWTWTRSRDTSEHPDEWRGTRPETPMDLEELRARRRGKRGKR